MAVLLLRTFFFPWLPAALTLSCTGTNKPAARARAPAHIAAIGMACSLKVCWDSLATPNSCPGCKEVWQLCRIPAGAGAACRGWQVTCAWRYRSFRANSPLQSCAGAQHPHGKELEPLNFAPGSGKGYNTASLSPPCKSDGHTQEQWPEDKRLLRQNDARCLRAG